MPTQKYIIPTQKTLSVHKKMLIEGLGLIPQGWELTPLKNNKAPYRKAWQHETPLSRKEIIAEIQSGRAKGFGIRTGSISGGIVAIDFDGCSATQKALELSGGEALPDTVTFTSNRPGREQRLYLIPQEYWGTIKTTKINTGVIGDNGKPEQLEFRWSGCQSVLPPSVHPETGHYHWRRSPQEVAIAPAPMWVIEAMLAEPEPAHQQPKQHFTSYTAKSRSGEEWSDEEWALSYLSALGPYRADDYDDWLTVGMVLQNIGEHMLPVWVNWSRHSSKYKPGDCEKKWKSFKGQGVALGTLGQMAKQDGWRSPADKSSGRGYCGGIGSGGSGGGNRRGNGCSGSSSGDGGDGGDGDGNNGKVVTHPNFIPVSGDELEARIDELITQKITGSKLTSCLNRLAIESQWHVVELRKLYFERKGETEQTEEQVEAQSLLPNLLQVHQLNLRELLWGDEGLLAEAMTETAKAMPTSPEFLLTTLLPTAATLIGTSSRIVVKEKGKYKQPCIFWATVVGRSGQLKTPAQKVVIDPLVQLEIIANEQYQLDLENYEIGLANWKKDKDADPAAKPKPPTRKRYITKDATTESLERIHGQNPRGLLVHRDEIAEDFKADNAYRNGKGGDTEKKLDQFNGSPLITDRKEREVILERSAISRTGSVQWEVLQSLMGDGRDDNGAFARWLFCAAEAPPRFINLLEDDIDTGIEELLTHLYKRLEKMPDKDYLLSFEAKKLFQSWQHELVRAEINETHTGLQVVYPKIEAYTARFALWLHLVNSALAEVTPPAVIGDRTMSAAIKLAKYYLEQAKLVMATNSPQSGLTGVLLKIQKYTQGKPNGVKIYKLKSGIKALRNTSQETLLSHCKWLSEHGYGSLKDNTYFVDRVDQLLPSGSTRSTPDSTVVVVNSINNLLTNCCPEVNTVNSSNSGSSSDFVDFVDQIDPLVSEILVTELNNPPSVELCNENSQGYIEEVNTVNTVNNSGEMPKESGVDPEQQLVNKGQHSQQADSMSAPMPLEQTNSTSADESSEVSAESGETELDKLKANFQVGDRVFVATKPHTSAMGPYSIERIEGDSAKLDLFSKLVPLAELVRCDFPT